MKRNGFTLVELMIVVVVIGILASIATPQFTNALARARAAEVPLNLNKIKSAQESYRAETKVYKNDCSWGVDKDGNNYWPGGQHNGKALGVKIDQSRFFNYYTDTTSNGFNAGANLIRNIGSAKAEKNVTIVLTESDFAYVKTTDSKSKDAMTLYLRSFISSSNNHQ